MARWQRSLYAAWTGLMLSVLGFQSILPFLPLFLQELGVHDPTEVQIWAGILAAASPLAMTVAAPLWGVLADRYGSKLMIIRSAFAGTVVLGGMALATDPWQLLFWRVMSGIFTGTVVSSTMLAAAISPRDRIGHSLGLMQMAVYFGASAGPFAGGMLADAVGYRTVLWLTAATLAVSGLIVLFFVESVPPEAVPDSSRSRGSPSGSLFGSMAVVVRDSWLLTAIVLLFSLQASRGAIVPILPLFVQSLAEPGTGVATQAGYILAAAGLMSSIASVLTGRLGDRVGYRQVLFSCTLVVALLDIPQFFVQNTWQLFLFRTGTGLFVGGIIPTANAIIGLASPPERRGAIFGLSSSATSLGMAIGPLVGATVAAGFGLRVVFLVTAAMMAAMGLWLLGATRSGAERWRPTAA